MGYELDMEDYHERLRERSFPQATGQKPSSIEEVIRIFDEKDGLESEGIQQPVQELRQALD